MSVYAQNHQLVHKEDFTMYFCFQQCCQTCKAYGWRLKSQQAVP
jgi:hypothetical protein